jgi:hypothetical protein
MRIATGQITDDLPPPRMTAGTGRKGVRPNDVARAALALRASGHDLVEVGLEFLFQAQRVDV